MREVGRLLSSNVLYCFYVHLYFSKGLHNFLCSPTIVLVTSSLFLLNWDLALCLFLRIRLEEEREGKKLNILNFLCILFIFADKGHRLDTKGRINLIFSVNVCRICYISKRDFRILKLVLGCPPQVKRDLWKPLTIYTFSYAFAAVQKCWVPNFFTLRIIRIWTWPLKHSRQVLTAGILAF